MWRFNTSIGQRGITKRPYPGRARSKSCSATRLKSLSYRMALQLFLLHMCVKNCWYRNLPTSVPSKGGTSGFMIIFLGFFCVWLILTLFRRENGVSHLQYRANNLSIGEHTSRRQPQSQRIYRERPRMRLATELGAYRRIFLRLYYDD